MKFVHHDYTLYTSKELIECNSCILKRIISETKSEQNIELEAFFDHTAIKYLFENLLLYPYFQPKEYNSFNELILNLNIETLRPIIEYYQMEKVVVLLRDLLDIKKHFCIEELKSFFALKKYFGLKLPLFNSKIFNFILKNLVDKNINLIDMDKDTVADITYIVLNNIKPYYVYQEIPSKYIIDLDNHS